MTSPYWLSQFDTSTPSQSHSSHQANAASASFQANAIHQPGKQAFPLANNTAGLPWHLAAANNSFSPAANFSFGTNYGTVPASYGSWPGQNVDYTPRPQCSDQFEQYFAARYPGVANPSQAFFNDDPAGPGQLPVHSDDGLLRGQASASVAMMPRHDNTRPAGFYGLTSAANYVTLPLGANEQKRQLAQPGFFRKTKRTKGSALPSICAGHPTNEAMTGQGTSKMRKLDDELADDAAKEIEAARKADQKQIKEKICKQVFALPKPVSVPDPSNPEKSKEVRFMKLQPKHTAEHGQQEGPHANMKRFLAKMELAKHYHAARARQGISEPEQLECYLFRDKRDTDGPPIKNPVRAMENMVQAALKQNRDALHHAVVAIVPSLLKALKPPKEHLETLFSGSDIATKSLLCLAIAQTFDVPSLQQQADSLILQHYVDCAKWYNDKGVRAYLQKILDVLAGDGRYVFCALAKAGIEIVKVNGPTGNAAGTSKFEFCYKNKSTADGIVGELLAEEGVEDYELIKLLTTMCYIALPNWIFSLLRVISKNQDLRTHLLLYEQGIVDLVRCKRIFLSIMQYIEKGDRIPEYMIHFMRNFFKKPDLSMDRKLLAYHLVSLICYAPWYFLVPDWCSPAGVFSFGTADGKRFNVLDLRTSLDPCNGSLQHTVVIGEQFGKADPDTRCLLLDFQTASSALRKILQADAGVYFYINGTPDALEALYAPISQACMDLCKERFYPTQEGLLPDWCSFTESHQDLLWEDLRQPAQCSLHVSLVSPFRGVYIYLYSTADVFRAGVDIGATRTRLA